VFKSARIKLTAWYLTIIMLVTLSFSGLVYLGVNTATTRALEAQRHRLEIQFGEFNGLNRPQMRFFTNSPRLDVDTLLEIRRQTLISLTFINLGVLVLSGTLGYFLAGKTLKPIEQMVEKQKRFTSDAAHEIKTPLTIMKTDMEVALRDKHLTVEGAKKTLKSSIEEVDNLHILTTKLLQLSKYQIGKSSPFENINLKELIEGVVKKHNSLVQKNNQEIELSLDSISILGNKTDIEQLYSNLFENAVKYSGKGSKIQLSLHSQGTFAVSTIEDNGPGISEEDLPYIFEPFYRSDKSRHKQDEAGFGLGLSIANEIIQRHDGKISVESKLNEGTKFVVRLPTGNDLTTQSSQPKQI
jgi:two-component system sensor histidine kinase CiaH